MDDELRAEIEPESKRRLRMIEELTEGGSTLTDWEDEFLGKLLYLLVSGRQLSPSQVDKLEQIYEERA